MRFTTLLCTALALLALNGCVYNRHRADEATAYYNAQSNALTGQKPIFEMEAREGEQIVLGGVKSFRVYSPHDDKVQPLPVAQSGLVSLANNIVDKGLTYYGFKFASATLRDVFDKAGDHSVTNITGSFNDQSDHSTHGDTITGSNLIGGNVSGPGAGIGNGFVDRSVAVSGNGAVAGNGNSVINGDRNGNSGRQDSPDVHDNNNGGVCPGGAGEGSDGGDCSSGSGH